MPVSSGERTDVMRRDQAAARFRALADVARVSTSSTGPHVLREVARAAMRALDGASVSLSRWEPEHGLVRCLLNEGDLGPTELPEPQDEVYSMLDYDNLSLLVHDQTACIARVDQEDQADPYVALLRSFQKDSCITAPIPLDGRVWGELFVTRRLDQVAFDESELDLAVAVAAQVGAAIATSEHLDRVQRLAHTDPLTGLANRRAVDERLDAAFLAHTTAGTSVGLVVCDLNGLKRLNDEQGHVVGDRALVRFAALLSAAAAQLPGALAARLGGDEFCIVATDVPADDLIVAAEELCRLVLKSPLEGVSCGVASTADDVGEVEEPSRLLRLADAAQYRAKRSRSTRPVVAGRTLPVEAAVNLAEHPHRPQHDRRALRGHGANDIARLLEIGLAALDESRGDPAPRRLAAVADIVGHHLDAVGWWLSVAPVDHPVVRSVRFALFRSGPGVHTQAGSSGAIGAEFALDDYPQTRLAVDGGAVCIQADDPEADQAEVALLDGMGGAALLLAGARGADGVGWLVEIFGDEISHRLTDVAAVVRTLVAVAVWEGAPEADGAPAI